MGLSRGASAPGVAVGLGEIDTVRLNALWPTMTALFGRTVPAHLLAWNFGHEILVIGMSDPGVGRLSLIMQLCLTPSTLRQSVLQ